MAIVTLLRPPLLVPIWSDSGPLTPPIGPAYLAASLRQSGHEARIVDGLGENPFQVTPLFANKVMAIGLRSEEIVERIDPDTDLIGVSCMFSQDWPEIRRLIQLGLAVAVYSATADPVTVRAAIRAGAAAFVSKTDQLEDVAEAIRRTADGTGWISPPLAFLLLTDDAPDRPALSPQEKQALQLYAAGLSMKAVAGRMGIAPETAKQYIDRVRKKYRDAGRTAASKIDLLRRAMEDGLIDPSGAAEPST